MMKYKAIRGSRDPRIIIETVLECPSECMDAYIQDLDPESKKSENAISLVFMLVDYIKRKGR